MINYVIQKYKVLFGLSHSWALWLPQGFMQVKHGRYVYISLPSRSQICGYPLLFLQWEREEHEVEADSNQLGPFCHVSL